MCDFYECSFACNGKGRHNVDSLKDIRRRMQAKRREALNETEKTWCLRALRKRTGRRMMILESQKDTRAGHPQDLASKAGQLNELQGYRRTGGLET